MTMKKTPKKHLKAFLFLTIPALVLAVGGAELALRIWWDARPFGALGNVAPSRKWFEKNVEANKLGFRGELVSPEKPPNTYRIVALGDSITFGKGIENPNKRYPELLGAMLDKETSADVQVVNMGFPMYNTVREYRVFKEKGLRFSPDLVLVGYNHNDPEGARIRKEVFSVIRFSPALRLMLSKSYLVSFIVTYLTKDKKEELFTEYIHFINSSDAPDFPEFKSALKGLVEHARDSGAEVVFVIFPTLYDLKSGSYEFQDAQDMIIERLEALDVKYVDLLPLLKGRKARRYWASSFDSHPNEFVHRLAAKSLLPVVEPMMRKRVDEAGGG